MIAKRKKASLAPAFGPVIEQMEQRRLLSATLSVSSSLMVFNAVENSSASATETVTLTDTGDAALTLGSSAFAIANNPSAPMQDAARFSLVNAGSAPATLAPGGSFALQLNYNAIAVTTNSAFLEISTNDPVTPTAEVTLHGIGTKGLGGTNQPSLATILQAYNIPTYVGEGVDDANATTDTTYPNPPDASSQEVVLQRLVKAGAGPVTINVLASFTASGFAKSYVLGTYTPGEPQTLNELFYDTSSQNQTTYVQPQGSTSFDPGSNPFGFYFISNVQVAGRVGYSEDAFNTWDTTNPRKFRFFPMETPSGTVVPDTYIMTSTEWNGPSGYDFTNIVAIVSNVTAAPSAPTAPVLGVQNLNALPGSTNMVFNTIQGLNPSHPDQTHTTGTLQVNNTGNSPLIISSYTLTPQWQLVSPPTFPVTIAAAGKLDLSVEFIATSLPSNLPYNETNSDKYATGGGVWDGTLVLNSNDPNNPTSTTQLRGYWQQNSENDNEPGFMTQANLMFGWDTYINSHPITTLYETNASTGSPSYYGEEVVSPYWAQADASTSISVQQIGGWHTEGNNATTSYYVQGSSKSPKKLFETANDDGQTFFPYAINTTTPAAATFSTTSTFGFDVDGVFTDDALNPGTPGAGHHFRFYPVRNASGDLLPNTYIMAMDYDLVPENFDFQDNLYIVTNIRPVTVVSGIGSGQSTGAPPAPADLNAISSNGVNTLQWAPPLYSSIAGYNVMRATSIGGPYTTLNTSPITTSTYTDTTAPATGTTSYYKVQTVDSVTGNHSLSDEASVANTGTQTTGDGAPVAAAETATTSAGTAVTINVVANATDNANGTIEASTVTVTTAPANGSTSVDPTTGIITYTPSAGFTGTDTFKYTVGDTTGAISSPAIVTVSVTNQPIGSPVAKNLSYTVQESSPFQFNPATSATDNANATIVPSSVAITLAPGHGTATVDPTTGNVIYTPSAGYLGKDTLQYTVSDSLSAVSQAATVTFTVSTNAPPTGPVSAPILASASSTGGSSVIDVLSSVSDASAALVPSSVTVSANPVNGTASVNTTTGQIVYTPNAGFVGTDSLQYTVADSNGLVSSAATVSINVGVTINNSTAKSLVFTDASGSKVTVVLAGGGSAMVFFTGTGAAETIPAAHHTGNIIVSGNAGGISGITITGSTIASSLTISRKGASSTSVGNISVGGAIGKISASSTNLTGALNISGGVSSIQFASISDAAITIGSAGARPGGVTLTTTNLTDSSITSALPIKSLKLTQWASTSTAGTITAPSISSLVTTGNFQAGITTTGGTPFSLGTVHIGGQAGGDSWNITGTANSIYLGSVASGYTGRFSSTLNSFTIKAGGFNGTLTAGTVNSLTITGNDTGQIVAGTIKSARVVGELDEAKITVTNGVAPRTTALGRLTVTGQTLSSNIISAGNIGTITTGGISGSSIDAGVAGGVFLPNLSNDFTAAATFSSFSITGKRNTFVDSNIAAQIFGSLNLGTITTSNHSVPFGVAGGAINSISATLDIGGSLRLNKTTLASSTSLSTYLMDKSISLGDFVIRLAL